MTSSFRIIVSSLLAFLSSMGFAGALVAQESTTAESGLVIFDASTPLDSIRLQDVDVARAPEGARAVKKRTKDKLPGINF